jgi:hypothetical protein
MTDCLTARFLLALSSTVILGSRLHGTHDHNLLSDSSRSLQSHVYCQNQSYNYLTPGSLMPSICLGVKLLQVNYQRFSFFFFSHLNPCGHSPPLWQEDRFVITFSQFHCITFSTFMTDISGFPAIMLLSIQAIQTIQQDVELITYFPLIWHRKHWKWCVQQFLNVCLRIHCCGNVFTNPLSSNNKGGGI